MKTILNRDLLLRASARVVASSKRITCSTISSADRSLTNPSFAVKQNVQPRPHPTCDEMQNVTRPSRGIRTASANSPSCRRSRYRTVPSAEMKEFETVTKLLWLLREGRDRVHVHRDVLRCVERCFQIGRHRVIFLEPVFRACAIARCFNYEQFFGELGKRRRNAGVVNDVTSAGR